MYEFTCQHQPADTRLEETLKRAFDEAASAPGAGPATVSVIQSEDGRRIFTARFERGEDAEAFRFRVAEDPEADARTTPRIGELYIQPDPASQIVIPPEVPVAPTSGPEAETRR